MAGRVLRPIYRTEVRVQIVHLLIDPPFQLSTLSINSSSAMPLIIEAAGVLMVA